MRRIPPAKALASTVLAARQGKTSLETSSSYLLQRRADLARYGSVEEFVMEENPENQRLRRACEFHLRSLRAGLARELWSRQLFIGVTVLDDLLFHAFAHHQGSTPVERVLELIRDHGLHQPGLVVFPVHSFGVLGAGLLHWFTDARIEYTSSSFGIALAPQTNSLAETVRFLNRAKDAFGVRRRVPNDLIEHWHRSRSAHWLTRNPLLVIKAQSFPGDYYENQFLLLSKLRIATAMLSMLAAMQPTSEERESRIWSSSMVNNFQTLDIKHYIVLFPHPSKRAVLDGDCVPMHLNPAALAEISQLGFDLDPRYWKRRAEDANRIFHATSAVHAGYLKNSFGAEQDSMAGRLFRKLSQSLSFFRRSFQRSDENWSAVISLAVAFEMLLTDGYAPKVNERIVRRARLLLRGRPGVRKLISAVDDLYRARGGIVHTGSTEIRADLSLARRAYVLAFVAATENLSSLSSASSTPAKDLTGDTRA